MIRQCKRALLTLASISMCLMSGVSAVAENDQTTQVTYTNGDYTFEKISHASSPVSTADGIVDYVGNGAVSEFDEGQGDRGQSYSWAAESYGDYMYVGTCYAAMGNTLTYMDSALGDTFDKETMKATLDALFNGTFFYGQDDGKDSGGILVKVNVKTGETKLIMANSLNGMAPLFRNAVKFRDKLYFCGSVHINGQRGLPSIYEVDPQTDTVKLAYRGIEPKDAYAAAQKKISTGIRGMTVYNDRLVISCVGLEGPYIMISSDPSSGKFTKIATESDLFNYPAYRYSDSIYGGSIWEIRVFNGDLYVALCTGTSENKLDDHTMQSFAIVKGHEEQDGKWTWTSVVGDKEKDDAKYTFGIDPERTRAGACNLLVYGDYLYIGEYQDIEIALEDVLFNKNVEFLAKNLEQSVNLYRMDKDENIELVVGDATNMFPNGSLSGQGSGFGQHENAYFWQSTEYKGNAYFGMFDSSSLLEPIGQLSNGDLLNKTPEEWKKQLNYIKVLIELLIKKNFDPKPVDPANLEENVTNEETDVQDILNEAIRTASVRYGETSVAADITSNDMIELTDEQTTELETFINEHPEDLNILDEDVSSDFVDTMFGLTSLGNQLNETGSEQFINDYEEILDFVRVLVKRLPEDQQEKILNLIETLLQITQRDNLLAFRTILCTLSTSIRGFDMYATGDGTNFTTITQNGFGDPYNHGLRVFAQTDDWMAIGTANPFYGTQLWKLQEENTEPTNPSKNIYTITFDDQKGNVTTVKAEEGTEVTFPTDPACDGYTFEGWFTESKEGTKVTSLIAEKDMTVYAQWKEVKKAEVKNDKSVDTSDKSLLGIYIVGIIVALGAAGIIFKSKMHSTK